MPACPRHPGCAPRGWASALSLPSACPSPAMASSRKPPRGAGGHGGRLQVAVVVEKGRVCLGRGLLGRWWRGGCRRLLLLRLGLLLPWLRGWGLPIHSGGGSALGRSLSVGLGAVGCLPSGLHAGCAGRLCGTRGGRQVSRSRQLRTVHLWASYGPAGGDPMRLVSCAGPRPCPLETRSAFWTLLSRGSASSWPQAPPEKPFRAHGQALWAPLSGWGAGMRPARGFSSLICEMVLPTHVLCPSCRPRVGRS